MKNKSIRSLVAAAILASASLSAPGVFAANPYGIVYSGGEPLSASNVQIDPTLINGLTTLMKSPGVGVELSNSTRWQDGYFKSGDSCSPIKYVDVTTNTPVTSADNLSLTYSKDQYKVKIQFLHISLDGVTDSTKKVPMTIVPGGTSIFGSWPSFADATCTTQAESKGLSAKNGERLFIEMNIKLYRDGQESVFTANDLFFGITDIDASQSFKILNSGNEFSPSNMFAKSAGDLQTTDPNITLKNMYVSGGKYLYTQYDPETGIGLDTPDNSNIYTKLTKTTQQDGLNVVFGFAGSAASAIEYYAKQFNITYKSDSNGTVSGITEEQIISGSYPSGSETTAKKDYGFEHWIADVDVTLTDGTVIRAGKPISKEEMKEIVVDQNIVFTAIHDKTPAKGDEPSKKQNVAVPNTGEATGEINAILVPVSVIGILLGALFIRSLPRLTHKKVNFDK